MRPWVLQENIAPGGYYGKGILTIGGQEFSIFVPPMELGLDPLGDFAYRHNANVNGGGEWTTAMRLQGMTSLGSKLDRWAVKFTLGTIPQEVTFGFGPPASLSIHRQVIIDERGYAWLGEPAERAAIDADDTATLVYGQIAVVSEHTGRYDRFRKIVAGEGFAPYELEGAVSGPTSMKVAAAANVLDLSVNVLGAGDIGARKYQILIQENRQPAAEVSERAIVQTYHVYQDGAGYQIRPHYLSMRPDGGLVETPITYPRPGAVIRPPGPCQGASTCYNTAKPISLR